MTRPSPLQSCRSALVVTVVHDPRDARIWFRQVHALLEHGWQVSYAAPFTDVAQVCTDDLTPGARSRLQLIDLPRAWARRRFRAAWRAHQLLRDQAAQHDVVLVHDPELLLVTLGLDLPNLVWDVHEDPAAALGAKQWMPKALRPPVARAWRQVEAWAEERFSLTLAERSYQDRFRHRHPVVVNAVTVPTSVARNEDDRVVYLGSVTPARGSSQLPAIGRGLQQATGGRVRLEVIGSAHDHATHTAMTRAHQRGDLVWHGFLGSDEALRRVSGALAGLALLHDTPNYHGSLPTKVVEYCALGVPVITTPLPLAAELVQRHDVGVVVPYEDPSAVVEAVTQLSEDPQRVHEMATRAHALALREHDWQFWSEQFVQHMDVFATTAARVHH